MKSSKLLIIALLSITLLGLELIWTRIFSAEYFYTFAFLILSLAILGLGLGALVLRLFAFLNRESSLAIFLMLTGITALAGPPAVLHLNLDFSKLIEEWTTVGKLLAVLAILSSAYFFGGMCLALLFKENHKHMPRLYMADLLGAGFGVILSIWLMNRFGTKAATFLTAIPVFLAALLACRQWIKLIPVSLCLVAVICVNQADSLLLSNKPNRARVIYEHWDAMSKIKLYGFSPEYRGIEIDNAANSPVLGFDGNWNRTEEERIPFLLDVDSLIKRFDNCTFLSLGAGGGGDVLQALQSGAAEVHAVEVNHHINHMMTKGDPAGYIPFLPNTENTNSNGSAKELHTPEIKTLAEFSGHIYDDPRVTVSSDDARAYVRRYPGKFDIIFSLSSNSFAAVASGSFALAENYLFTSEAFGDYWNALTDSGFLVMEHQFYMPRLVSGAIEALKKAGVEDYQSHLAIYNLPQHRRKVLLLSKQPLTNEIRNSAIGELTEDNAGLKHLLYPTANGQEDNHYTKIVNDGWQTIARTIPVNISPSTDERPFVAQMGLWRNFQFKKPERLMSMSIFGFPLAQVIIVTILLVVVFIIIPLNILPYAVKGGRLRSAGWLYFFLIGAGFMAIEVVLMQKYTLFVGPSVYSISTILLTLLIAAGIGSRFADRVSDRTPFIMTVLWLICDITVFGHITDSLSHLLMPARIAVTAALVFPLGFFLGMPFPKGALRAGELIDWGFAVNGAASVLGGTAIVLVAMTWGFTVSLLCAAIIYLIAMAILSSQSSWTAKVFDSAETNTSTANNISEPIGN